MSYQLCLGDQPVDVLIDRIVLLVCEVAPGLPPATCRELVDLIFRSRVRQTAACGHHDACRPIDSLWGERPVPAGTVAPAGWHDLDPEVLPRMFAATAVGLMDLAVADHAPIEQRLAWAFRRALGPFLFVNPACGHAAICDAAATTPFLPIGKVKKRSG